VTKKKTKDDTKSGVIALQFDDGRGQVGEPNEFRRLLEEQKDRFKAKFQRDPAPREPLFFDPDQDQPVPIPREKLSPELSEFFTLASLHAALVFAQVKVGFFLSPLNYDVATDEQSVAWDEAVREFAYLKGIL
jgi:hypothetical protein